MQTMKTKLLSLVTVAVIGMATSTRAQVPTIDVSSLQQLYAQYQKMQEQLKVSDKILGKTTDIFNQEVKTYQTALGDITKVARRITGWMDSFKNITSIDAFQSQITGHFTSPIQGFESNIKTWARLGFGQESSPIDTKDKATRYWEGNVEKVNNGTATDWQKNVALSGYNSKIIENSQNSRTYGTQVVGASKDVVNGAKDGTLIEQAGAQNALLYQQTALLDRMKNDINDATVAEAAHREHQLQIERERAIIRRAMSNIAQQ